jgi:hypothetical protein
MRPAVVAALTEPSSTQPGSCRNAYTVGAAASFTLPSRATSARSEYTVTLRIVDETAMALGSSTKTTLACGTSPLRSTVAEAAGFAVVAP